MESDLPCPHKGHSLKWLILLVGKERSIQLIQCMLQALCDVQVDREILATFAYFFLQGFYLNIILSDTSKN